MIDLLLEVYNYLIKPRLQNLEGQRVSLKEKKEGEKERKVILCKWRNVSVPWVCLPWICDCCRICGWSFLLATSPCIQVALQKANCRQSLLCADGRQINYLHFLSWKKENLQIRTGNHSFDELLLHYCTHTHTTSPFLSCKQTCIQLTSPLSSRHTERHVTFSSHFVFRLLLLWNFKKTYFVSTFCKEKKGER